ncbi:MAG: hypothetical protein K8I03_07995 [Ignavibacteria bacterium]|nr:hypothetical protein [Ignavibacteria bacterium]
MKPQEGFNSNSWQQHYLQLEVKRFEVTLKHFFETGIVNQQDYQFLISNMKMVKTFLNARLPIRPQKQPGRKDYWGNPNYFKKRTRSRKSSYTNNPKQLSLFDINNPLPIIGEIKITGLNERLDALKPREPEKAGPKFPHKIPAGTHWNNVIVKFLNNEKIEIWVKRLKHITDFKEMGMVGKGKVPSPSEQWVFLKVLAQCHGEITIKDTEAKDTYKKQKQGLTEILQKYFSIDYDPFYPYKSSHEKSGNSYKIKLTLIPPPIITVPNNPVEINDDVLGIQEFLNEEAPQVIED